MVLWFEWDPIGIRGIGPRDEYQSYVPEIFHLVKGNTDQKQIAVRLLELEAGRMG